VAWMSLIKAQAWPISLDISLSLEI